METGDGVVGLYLSSHLKNRLVTKSSQVSVVWSIFLRKLDFLARFCWWDWYTSLRENKIGTYGLGALENVAQNVA
jgi:hypothetical protein